MSQIKTAIIPIAGKGTRFYPITKSVMKTMLPIIDKPTIQYIIEEAILAGIEHIVIVLGPNQTLVKDYFQKEESNYPAINELNLLIDKINIDYVVQENPLGLGHAILLAKDYVKEEAFAVMLGDDLVKKDENKPFFGIHSLCDCYQITKQACLGVQQVPLKDCSKYGVIESDNYTNTFFPIHSIVEKPLQAPSQFAVLGRYIFNQEIFKHLENTLPGINKEIQLTDAIASLLKEKTIYACIFDGSRYDIGSKIGYIKANISYGLDNPEWEKEIKKEISKSYDSRKN